ncbi:MAG: cyclic pyranopterin monophosphate synthase MoaC [Rhodococcus erythropolis]
MPDTATGLTHLRDDGSAHMVDIGEKKTTERSATARSVVVSRTDVIELIASGKLPKGEALGTARIAGILGAKATSTLIPLCHPLPITHVSIDLIPDHDRVVIEATVSAVGRTGVEMEALTAASVAALTVYDMIKAVDREATIAHTYVVRKQGGKSGDWMRDA